MEPTLEALVTRARAALADQPPDTSDATTGPYKGSAGEGLVTAEVDINGRVDSLSIDPLVLRRPIADLASAARAAINAALSTRPGRVDFAPLAELLTAVQEQAETDLTAILQAIADASEHIRHARERP